VRESGVDLPAVLRRGGGKDARGRPSEERAAVERVRVAEEPAGEHGEGKHFVARRGQRGDDGGDMSSGGDQGVGVEVSGAEALDGSLAHLVGEAGAAELLDGLFPGGQSRGLVVEAQSLGSAGGLVVPGAPARRTSLVLCGSLGDCCDGRA